MNDPFTATSTMAVRCAQQRMHGESPWPKPRMNTAVPTGPSTSASTANASTISGTDRGECAVLSGIPSSVIERRQQRCARAQQEDERHQRDARDEQPECQCLLLGPAENQVQGSQDDQKIQELHELNTTAAKRLRAQGSGLRAQGNATNRALAAGAYRRGRSVPAQDGEGTNCVHPESCRL